MKNVLAVVALVMVAGITMAQNEKVTLSPEQINAAVDAIAAAKAAKADQGSIVAWCVEHTKITATIIPAAVVGLGIVGKEAGWWDGFYGIGGGHGDSKADPTSSNDDIQTAWVNASNSGGNQTINVNQYNIGGDVNIGEGGDGF